MVAKVISGQNIKGALNYNEQKIVKGKATCILANLFHADVDNLNFYLKLTRFTDLNERNHRTKTNTLHISLNFDMNEKLPVDDLNKIASIYMDRIGFGDQPYLVYQHHDAAHPHLHILTTLIKEDGKRIPIHYLGKNESEKARKEIEIEFNLVKAQSKTKDEKVWIQPIDVKKAIYGKSETKRSISNIVRMVTHSYKYTSLPELNAILRQFNVIADRGTEKSIMFDKKGLVYSVIDDQGKRVGIPIKASSIYGKPTLSFLEKQFALNKALKNGAKVSFRKSIDQIFQSHTIASKEDFKNALDKVGIAAVFRSNDSGRTYGVTFVNNKTKIVFNGSDLGKAYSANAILQRIGMNKKSTPLRISDRGSSESNQITAIDSTHNPLVDLMSATEMDFSSPEAALKLRRNKRKRRKR